MLDFNNARPQRAHTGYFGGMANDQAQQASGGGLSPVLSLRTIITRRSFNVMTHARTPTTRRAPAGNWTLDADAFECRCAVCSSQDQ
jgi:hypothetical protein